MSVESISQALHVQGLSASEKLVLIGIANHDGDGGAWPSIETLSTYLGASERATQYAVANLVKKGFITVEKNAGGTDRTRNDRRPNLYRLHLDGVKQMSPRVELRGEVQRAHGVKPVAPEPSLEPSLKENTRDSAFEDFWKAYPAERRAGKPSALRAWRKIEVDEQLAVMLGLSLWAQYWKAVGTENRFIPHAATWLNDRRWENPPQTKLVLSEGPSGHHWSNRHQTWIADGMG